ncbi:hypothetical protein GCM10029992_58520 [Glycomyces albus]
MGEGVDAVGVGLGGVVLPQLGPGVGPLAVLLELAQRGAVGQGGQDGAGGEVGGDPDDLVGADAGGRERLGDGMAQHVAPVVGGLERPTAGQGNVGSRERLLDRAVPVDVLGAGEFAAVGDSGDDHSSGEGSEVDPDSNGFVVAAGHEASLGWQSK